MQKITFTKYINDLYNYDELYTEIILNLYLILNINRENFLYCFFYNFINTHSDRNILCVIIKLIIE